METATKPNGQANGQQVPAADVIQRLVNEATLGYRPTLPVDTMWGPDGYPFYQLRRDIEYMLWHPMVRTAMNYYKSGVAGAQFWGGENPDNADDEKGLPISKDANVSRFVSEQCQRFWDWGVPQLQAGYEYGWSAGECEYIEKDGKLQWQGMSQFAPYDVFLLTQDCVPVGVRVKNIKDKGKVDLPLASGDVPAKTLWYAHNPRFSRYYGQSQLIGAWRPWRRLAWKDGAETVLDGGCYRFAYAGIIIRYPMEDLQGPAGSPNTTVDSQGNPMRYSRDVARQIGEQFKAGATVGLPSTKYHQDYGGGYKWEIDVPKTVLNVDPIINYIKNLHDQISYGIGVPPELLQASEVGSGYSGRAIPMEAFLDGQQKVADAFLQLFVDEVLRQLVRLNFSDVPWTVKVKSLLKTRMKSKMQQQPPQPQPQAPPGAVRPPAAAFSLVSDRVREIARKIRRAA